MKKYKLVKEATSDDWHTDNCKGCGGDTWKQNKCVHCGRKK
jgi:hypothetical protein